MKNLINAIGKWEHGVKEVERNMGRELPEVVKVAALVQMCPGDIQDIPFQSLDKMQKVPEVKDKILGLVSNRQAINNQTPIISGA